MRVALHWVVAPLLTGLLPAGHAVAASTVLTFVAVETSDGHPGVLSLLFRREDGGDGVPLRAPDGRAAPQFEHTEPECLPEIQYRLVPVNAPLYSFPADDWRSCRAGATYRYEFTPSLDSADAAIVYRIFSGGGRKADLGLTPEQIAILKDAIASADLGTITFYSTELGRAFDAAGDGELAQQWRNAAVAAGWAAVVAADLPHAPSVATPYVFEDDRLVYSDEAQSVIQSYQAGAGLPDDGRLNWPTMRSLSDLASKNITRLEQLKQELIQPVGLAMSR